MKKKVQILLADDHEIVRRGVRPLLENEWGWESCGEAVDGRQAVELAAKLQPDIIVMDVSMRQLGGVEATRQIKRDAEKSQILIFTGTESESLVHQLFSAGA